MKYRLVALAALLTAASGAMAQNASPVRLELRPFAGRYVPAGSQADDFKTAAAYGLQSALELSSNMHVLASVGWTDGRSKIPALSNDVARMWQYDVGAEFNGVGELGYSWLFRPFVGVGAGARTYNYEASGANANTCTSGYAALGTEFQRKMIAFRLESRGYVTCFKSPLTGQTKNRSDGLFSFGLAYHVN